MKKRLRQSAARLWERHPREAVAVIVLGAAGSLALLGSVWSTPAVHAAPPLREAANAPPAPPPLLVRNLDPEEAVALNRAIPLSAEALLPARPFSLGKASESARAQAIECLTSAVYYEAATESAAGQKAVAQVVLNRVRHPAFPNSVCGVVYEGSTRATGCQFTFTCDGSLARGAVPSLWKRAREIAKAALSGSVFAPVGTATHYHADYVVPYWASSLAKNAVVGAHIFYRWPGGWGRPAAFSQRYAQREPDSAALRLAAVQARTKAAPAEAIAAIPGAEPIVEPTAISGGKRVAVRFKLQAREAVEAAERVPYVERVTASDNLRWTLSGAGAAQAEPLGSGAPATASRATETREGGAAGGGAALE